MKEKFKKIFEFLSKPPVWFSLVSYGLFFVFSAVAIVLTAKGVSSSILSVLFGFMGLTFFYSCYLFIWFDFKKIKNFFKNLKKTLATKSKFLNKLFFDIYFRTMLSTIFSLILGLGFVSYNAFAGIYYHSLWNGSISVYYFLLVLIKIMFLIIEYKLTHNKSLSDELKQQKQAKTLKAEGVLLVCLTVALTIPLTIIATIQKQVNLPFWVAILNACYAFYKIIVCIYSFVKTRKSQNLPVIGLKNLGLISACVTMLSLENTLILTFSESLTSGMQIMMILSCLCVLIVNVVVAIITILKGQNEIKKFNLQNKEKIEK